MGDIALAHHQSSNESRRERRAKKGLQGDGGVGAKVGETDNSLNNLDVVSVLPPAEVSRNRTTWRIQKEESTAIYLRRQ